MGGGTSIWASPEWKSDPREIFNWKLWYLTTTVAFAGCSYGFDQGNIGGVLTLPSFKKAFGLDVLSETEADERGMCAGKGCEPSNQNYAISYTINQCVNANQNLFAAGNIAAMRSYETSPR